MAQSPVILRCYYWQAIPRFQSFFPGATVLQMHRIVKTQSWSTNPLPYKRTNGVVARVGMFERTMVRKGGCACHNHHPFQMWLQITLGSWLLTASERQMAAAMVLLPDPLSLHACHLTGIGLRWRGEDRNPSAKARHCISPKAVTGALPVKVHMGTHKSQSLQGSGWPSHRTYSNPWAASKVRLSTCCALRTDGVQETFYPLLAVAVELGYSLLSQHCFLTRPL